MYSLEIELTAIGIRPDHEYQKDDASQSDCSRPDMTTSCEERSGLPRRDQPLGTVLGVRQPEMMLQTCCLSVGVTHRTRNE